MAVGVLCPNPILFFLGNNGLPLVNGTILTQVGGVNTATYQDVGLTIPLPNPIPLNSRGEVSSAAGASQQLFLTPNVVYTFTFSDSSGNQQWVANYVNGIQISQAIIGGFLYPQIAAEPVGSVINIWYPYFDLRRYGGDPTGGTTSDAALLSAIATCGSTGGTIRAPAGTYTFANQIVLNNKNSIIIQGDGAATAGSPPATVFTYQGTGTGVWISMLDTVGIQFRGIQLTHSNSSFTGTYIKCGNGGSRDSAYCGVFDGTMGSSVSATVHLDLDKTICWDCENVNFLFGNPSVKGQSSAGGSYSNIVNFFRCYWHSGTVAPVYDGGQAWKFDSCNFEPLTGGAPGAFLSSNGTVTSVAGLTFIGCGFYDSTIVGGWIDVVGQNINLIGNYIGGNSLSTAINLRHVHGLNVTGNTFATHLSAVNTADTSIAQVTIKDNVCNSLGISMMTMQLALTGAPIAGATSATLTSNWVGTTGTYQMGFSDAEVKNVTLTNGAATVTWSGGLTNGVSVNVLVGAGFNVTAGTLECNLNFGLSPPIGHVVNATNGYEAGPNGTIRMWGLATGLSNGNNTITFPIAFPNNCFNVNASLSGVLATTARSFPTTLTAANFVLSINDAGATTDTAFWSAIGN